MVSKLYIKHYWVLSVGNVTLVFNTFKQAILKIYGIEAHFILFTVLRLISLQCCRSVRIIFLGSQTRIRIKVECRARIQLKIPELWRLKMELWRAVDAYNRGMEAQMEAWRIRRPLVADLRHFDEKQVLDPDPHQS